MHKVTILTFVMILLGCADEATVPRSQMIVFPESQGAIQSAERSHRHGQKLAEGDTTVFFSSGGMTVIPAPPYAADVIALNVHNFLPATEPYAPWPDGETLVLTQFGAFLGNLPPLTQTFSPMPAELVITSQHGTEFKVICYPDLTNFWYDPGQPVGQVEVYAP